MKSRFKESLSINGRILGRGFPAYIIAEAGVNHFADMERAYRLVDMAVEAGVDCVKFQHYCTTEFISSRSPEWRDRMRSKELTNEQFCNLLDYARSREITMIASAHEERSLEFLIEIGLPAIKIGSGEKCNFDFFRKAARSGRPILFSTGMYLLEDIERTLGVLDAAEAAEVALLHCNTLYPTQPEEVNLRTLDLYRECFGIPIGYSDHTIGIDACVAAIARGACLIEKHIALEAEYPGTQDPIVSCTPDTLPILVQRIRETETLLGEAKIAPVPREQASTEWACKSIVAARNLKAGTVLERQMLTCKRPGDGLDPSRMDDVIGKILKRDISTDIPIQLEDLSS